MAMKVAIPRQPMIFWDVSVRSPGQARRGSRRASPGRRSASPTWRRASPTLWSGVMCWARTANPKRVASGGQGRSRGNAIITSSGETLYGVTYYTDKVAYPFLCAVYGESMIRKELPLEVYLVDNTWRLVGSWNYGPEMKGGVATIVINKSDGRVLKVVHSE